MAAPPPGEAHLYLVHVPGAGHCLDGLMARLSPAERARAADKRVAEKRREYVTGQAALRTLLGRMLAVDPQQVGYRRGIKGKPYLDGEHAGSGLQFNITHSGGVVVAAMAHGPEVGIDVEWHNERTDAGRVARRAFTEAERDTMEALPAGAQRHHFFQVWTCKEALVKCTGLGIHSGMDRFQVAVEGGRAQVTGAWERQQGVERLHVHPLPLGDGHAGALVHEPPALEVRLFQLAAMPDPLCEIA